jgi:hypothetical protein
MWWKNNIGAVHRVWANPPASAPPSRCNVACWSFIAESMQRCLLIVHRRVDATLPADRSSPSRCNVACWSFIAESMQRCLLIVHRRSPAPGRTGTRHTVNPFPESPNLRVRAATQVVRAAASSLRLFVLDEPLTHVRALQPAVHDDVFGERPPWVTLRARWVMLRAR